MNKLILFCFLISTNTFALSAKEIMTKNEEVRKLQDFQSRAKITTGSKVKEFTFWRKMQADGVHNSTLTRFHSPAEVKDEGILIVETNSGKNDVLLYLPSFKKIRRVESQQQSGSFMGSVFSYSDIATPHVEDYGYKMLGEEKCLGDGSLKCFKIECTPSSEAVKERTGYSRSLAWVRSDNFMVDHAEYYNLEGKFIKMMKASEIKMVDPVGKKWLSHALHIENQITKEVTELKFSNVKVNSGISDAIFTQQNLQKVK